MTSGGIREYRGCLKHLAFDPIRSLGRRWPLPQRAELLAAIDPYRADAGRLRQCKALRRLADKTQVFPLPMNAHVRTRRVHTDEVVDIAVSLADFLGLNVTLCEAIALGHDIGHAPFGHCGERALTGLIQRRTGDNTKRFVHATAGVVVAQKVERRGQGLNLTAEVLQGIALHTGQVVEAARVGNWLQEYAVVKYADAIAFALADPGDIVRYGIAKEEDFPPFLRKFGELPWQRQLYCMEALIRESAERGEVSFACSPTAQEFEEVKLWPYRHIYEQMDVGLSVACFERAAEYFGNERCFAGCDPIVLLALMTDGEMQTLSNLMLRHQSNLGRSRDDLKDLSVMEILPYLMDRDIDLTDPDLGWGVERVQGELAWEASL